MGKVLTLFIIISTIMFGQTWNQFGPEETYNVSNLRVSFINQDSIFVTASPSKLYFTSDGGSSWELRFEGIENFYGPTLTVDNNNQLFMSAFGGAYRSPDFGYTWERIDTNIEGDHDLEFGGIRYINNHLVMTGLSYNYFSTDAGETWVKKTSSGGFAYIDGYAYAGGNTLQFGGFRRSTDFGDTWEVNGSFMPYSMFVTDDSLVYIFNDDDHKIYFSQDHGDNFTAIKEFYSSMYFGFAGKASDGKMLANFTSGNWIGLYWCYDPAGDWHKIQTPEDTEIQGAFIDKDDVIFAITNKGILTYNGFTPVEFTSFTALANNGEVTLSWQTATEVNNKRFDIERRKDNSDWVKIGSVQGNGTTTEVKNYVYVDHPKAMGNYKYRLKQVDFDESFDYSSVESVLVGVPSEMKLEQNSPNPFNPATSISFSLPEAANVKLTVYNLLGEKVASLINNKMEAGTHSVPFNAADLTSGIYLYRLEAGNFVQTKKMILMK